jgi:hypothetical protein
LIAILTLIEACGREKANKGYFSDYQRNFGLPIPERVISPYFQPYLDQFIIEASARDIQISSQIIDRLRRINFVDAFDDNPSRQETLGSCNYYNEPLAPRFQWKEIKILNPELWNYSSSGSTKPEETREVIFHELYHCLLERGHLPEDGPIDGIMLPMLTRYRSRVFNDWPGLLDDMFSATSMEATPPIAEEWGRRDF